MKKILWSVFFVVFLVCLLAFIFLPIRWAYAEAPTIPPKPPIKEYAKARVIETFGSGWLEFEAIIAKESRWEVWGPHYPKSKLSSAMGACGFLNQTWKDMGYIKTTDPYVQIDACIKYAKVRYGNPQKALAFHKKIGWW